MTQREKIELLKDTIVFLYEKEGRSKSYISRLLKVNRKTLSNTINYEWKLKQGNISYLTPSNQKFLNKHRNLIKSRLDNDVTIMDISKELGVDRQYLTEVIIKKDEILSTALDHYHKRKNNKAEQRLEEQKLKSAHRYNIENLEGEKWVELLGYEGYFVSNKGRFKKYVKTYDDCMLIKAHVNKNNGRLYVWVGSKAFQLARLVGFSFVEGHSETNNTINHIDKDVKNNRADNLEWVSQSENNQQAYNTGRPVVKAYQKYGKFKKIILNEKYEFKTIRALAKFIGKSETQTRRYIDNEADADYKFEFVY